jgi:hypothetical protein
MVGMNMSTPAPSSKRIIEGIPSPITFYMDLVLNMREYVEEAMAEAIEEEVKEASKSLVGREPKYRKFLNDFDVTYQDATFSYKVSGTSAEEARSLEYGPPARALVRHEAIIGSKRLATRINERFDKLTGYGNLA